MPYKYPFSSTDEATKLAVWRKGRPIAGYDEKTWRYDMCGKVMRYSDHGNTESKHGWEIDHIKPVSAGGRDTLDNLQPLFWETNRSKADQWPWDCSMR